LINGADVIHADEPTGALDSSNGKQVLDLLKQLHSENGTTIILITHDPAVAKFADRVLQMRDGELISDSTDNTPALEKVLSNQHSKASTKIFPRISLFTSMLLALRALRANLFRTLLTLL